MTQRGGLVNTAELLARKQTPEKTAEGGDCPDDMLGDKPKGVFITTHPNVQRHEHAHTPQGLIETSIQGSPWISSDHVDY